jgi:hypothetical protein
MLDGKEAKEKAEVKRTRTIEVEPEDLMATCVCRKVAMVVRGGKRRLDTLDAVSAAVRESCLNVCECKAVLVNVTRKPHD